MLQMKLLLNRYIELDNIEEYLITELSLIKDSFYKSLSENEDHSLNDPKYPSLKIKMK